ncbi:hypothetical protein K523DRAFT_422298 [Schizophyllum commune Tattone D]|nr:hypothetical protein K523DRAFT_422298 [Schizophyllum commune Tattone D]
MPELSPDDSEALKALIGMYGEGIVEQYAKATFSTVVIKLKNLSAKNASEWIKIKRNAFLRSRTNIPFNTLIDDASQTPTQVSSYAASHRAPGSSLPPSSPPGYSPVREPLSPPLLSDSPDLLELFVHTPIEKRKRRSTGDSDMPTIINNPPSPVVKLRKKKKNGQSSQPEGRH